MSQEADLVHYKEQLALVRKQITKLRSTHVSSYGYGSNTASYRAIDDLVKDESRLISLINKLEASNAGQTNTSNRVFKGFTRFK